MALAPKDTMTVADFLAWAETQADQRYELLDGTVVAMASERAEHVRAKQSVFLSLRAAIAQSGADCEAFMDGLAVKVDEFTAFIPDAIVNCGAPVPGDHLIASQPVIVVEVRSPSTQHIDNSVKLLEYFRVASLMHYIIVNTSKRAAVHHRRSNGDRIETSLIRSGDIVLDPPGLTIALEDLLG